MADDYGAAIDSYMAGPTPAQNLKNTLVDAVKQNPDQAAGWRQAAAQIGVPVDTAAALPDWSKGQQKLKNVNADELADLNPVTAAFLTQPTNAAIAHDDTANMGLIEIMANSFRRGVPALQQDLASMALVSNTRALEQFDAVAARIDAGEDPGRILANDDPMGVAWMTPAERAAYRASITTPQAGNIATTARKRVERQAIPQPEVVGQVMAAKTFGDAFSAFMQAPVQFIASVGPESLVSSAPGIALAVPAGVVGGPGAAAAVMGAGSYATDYGSQIVEALTAAGVDVSDPAALTKAVGDTQLMRRVAAQAHAHAQVVGAVDAVSGGVASKIALPNAVATKLAAKPVARELANVAVQVPAQGALGGIGEAGGELAAGQELSPGNILAEMVGEAFTAPAEIASVAGRQVIERVNEARAAEVHAERVEQLGKLVEASKLRERDPATFKAFVDQIAEGANGNPSELYIDAQTLVETLNQAGIGMTALQQVAPDVAAQLSQGEFMPGTDVRLPVSELLSAPTELTQPLIDHLRASPESMSRAEAGEYLKTQGDDLRATVEQELAKADNREAYQAEVKKVYDYFQSELDTAGKFRPEVNKAYATLLGNFYATQAARAGIPLAEFMDRYQLRVRAKTPQQGAGQTLEQGIPAGMTEDEYIARINPEGKRREFTEAMPLEAFAEVGVTDTQVGVASARDGRTIQLVEGTDPGAIVALIGNKTVGYVAPEGGTTGVFVADEYKGQGVGVALSTAYRSRNPFAQSGGLSEAGERTARAAFRNIQTQQRLEQPALPDRLIQTQVTDKDGTAYDITITRGWTGNNRDTPQVLVEARTADGNRRGMIDFSVDEDGTIRAELARVAGAFQRKGLASAMYKAAQEAGYKIAPGRAQTESGAGMVRALQAQGVIGEGAITPTSEYQQSGVPDVAALQQEVMQAEARLDERRAKLPEGHPLIGVGERVLERARIALATAQTAREPFDAWFGASKITDNQGRPLVVYHGGGPNIEVFRRSSGGRALWFADADTAQTYAGAGEGATLYPVYLKAENPMVFDAQGATWQGLEFEGERVSTDDLAAIAEGRGHDGLVIHNLLDANTDDGGETPATHYAVFEPEQIKSATGNRGTFDPNSPSILEQGARPDLMLTHNLTVENLLHAQRMGGLAAPSLAVTRGENPLTGFGEITLVGSPEMADPKGGSGIRVFGADIYSPRYPSVERDIDRKAEVALTKRLKPMAEKLGVSTPGTQELQREGQRELERNIAVTATFLAEQGVEPEIVMRKGMDDARRARLESFGMGPFLEETDFYTLTDNADFVAAAVAERKDAYKDLGKRDVLVQKLDTDEGFQRNVARDTAREIANAAKLDKRPEADRYATQQALEKQVEQAGLANQYQQFVADELTKLTKSERIFQGFTNSGNRRYIPHTLENVVKSLKKDLRGGESFNYGVGSLRAKFTPEFKTVKAIRSARDRLVSAEQFEKVKTEIDAEFNAVSEAIDPSLSSDTASAILGDAAKKGVVRAAKDYGYDISDAAAQKAAKFLERLRNLPTAYFEAKIPRAVGLGEFAGAVVPSGIDPKALEALKSQGVTDIRTYERGNEADRAAKLGEFQNLMFQGARGTLSFANDITTAPSVVALLENADLSTFLHESGHFFLEVQADLAARIAAKGDEATPAEKLILEDFNKLLSWFGVQGAPEQSALDTWFGMTTDERRESHEQFARSFERYLMEGNAPSQALNSLFARFRSWLVSIYQTLASLNSNLDDDVRAVMDRMVASDQAIAEQQAARGMGTLFNSPEQAGMTLDEFNAYHALAAQATANAETVLDERLLKDMKWMSGARNKAIKAAQADAAAKRNAIEAQVRAEVLSEPVYRAWYFLTGKNTGETVVPGVTRVEGIDVEQENGKLRTSLVKEMDPAAAQVLISRHMTNDTTGMHPDIAAELFGYASGSAMVKDLAVAQDPEVVIEGKTDQRMLEEYGDITSPAALNRAADEAVHNEVRARVIAAELAALQRANRVRGENPNEVIASRRSTVDVMARAAREYAERVVARLQLKNLRPKQYTAAEARSAKLAEQNLGNTAEAAMHKRNQLVNNYAAKAAFEAQDQVRKANEFFKRVMKGTPEDIAKTRDVGIVQAARAVLSLYGIGTLPKGESAQNYIDTLAKNNPDMAAIITERIGALVAGAKPVGELTVEQFQGLAEEVQSLWYLAKRTRQVEIDGKLVDRESVQADLIERMTEIGVPARVPGEGQAVTDAERRRTKLQTLGAALRRVETWVGIKDGKDIGAFRKYVWQPVKEAADRYRADKATYIKRYKELLDTLDLGKQRIDAPELGYTFGHSRGGSGKAEILHALLHTGNESNKRKLLLGRKWATENADGTLDTANWDAFVKRMIDTGVLTKADYDFAQGVWDLLEQTKPLAQAAHRATFGYYFNEVSADSFETPFGAYRGGYVPAMTDPEVVKDAATRKLQEDENQTLAYAFPSTNKGFTKSRVEYNRPLLLDLRTISSHIDKVLLFSHMEQPVRDVRRVLSSPQVSTMLHRIDPTAYDSLLTPWLNRAARQTVEQRVPGDANMMRFFSIARQHAGLAAMFGNVSNTAQQITGFSLAALKVRPKYLMNALAAYTIAPRQMARTVAESSIYMNNRMSSEVGKMSDAIDEILLNPNVYQKAQNWTKQHTYFLQSAVDNIMGPIIWTGAYNQALEAGHSERDAVRLADSAIRETQGSTLPEDVSRIETGNAFVRMFTQFAGYFNMQANLMQGEFAKTMHSMGLRQGMGRGLYIFVFGFLVPNIVAEAISQAFKGGPDDEDKDGDTIDDWLRATLLMGNVKGALAMIPVAGQVTNAALGGLTDKPYDDRIATSPAISMIESAAKAPTSVYNAVVNDGSARKAIRDTATLISITTGLPATAIARPVGYIAGVMDNRVAPTGPIDAARGVITGTPSPESTR